MSNKKITFFFFVFKEIRRPVLVSYKLESRICLVIPEISLNFPPAFQNIEAAFERCFTKVVAQQNCYDEI